MQQIKIHNKSKHKLSVYKSICLLNMPKIGLNNPPMGPAIMQAIAKELGSIVHFQDVNLSFAVQGANNYTVDASNCQTLAPDARCLLTVNYQATALADHNATISITTDKTDVLTSKAKLTGSSFATTASYALNAAGGGGRVAAAAGYVVSGIP